MNLAARAARGDLREVRAEIAAFDDRAVTAHVREALVRGPRGTGVALFRVSHVSCFARCHASVRSPCSTGSSRGARSILIDGLRDDSQLAELLSNLDPDDRAEALDELPATVVTRVLRGLAPEQRRMTATLLGYPAGAVGRRMTPEFASVAAAATVGRGLDRVLTHSETPETIYMLSVVGPARELGGGGVAARGQVVTWCAPGRCRGGQRPTWIRICRCTVGAGLPPPCSLSDSDIVARYLLSLQRSEECRCRTGHSWRVGWGPPTPS